MFTTRWPASYTVDRYLDDLEKRYGGIDSVLIWPTYPNMGIDDRNQHDMIRCNAGRSRGVKQMVADFHRRGVRVLFPMMMWDQGTREPGMPWPRGSRRNDGGDRRRRNQRRHAGWCSAGLFTGGRKDRPSSGLSTRVRALTMKRSPGMCMTWGEYRVPVCARGRSLQVARATTYGEHFRSLESRQDRRSSIRLLQRSWLGQLGERLGHLERR